MRHRLMLRFPRREMLWRFFALKGALVAPVLILILAINYLHPKGAAVIFESGANFLALGTVAFLLAVPLTNMLAKRLAFDCAICQRKRCVVLSAGRSTAAGRCLNCGIIKIECT